MVRVSLIPANRPLAYIDSFRSSEIAIKHQLPNGHAGTNRPVSFNVRYVQYPSGAPCLAWIVKGDSLRCCLTSRKAHTTDRHSQWFFSYTCSASFNDEDQYRTDFGASSDCFCNKGHLNRSSYESVSSILLWFSFDSDIISCDNSLFCKVSCASLSVLINHSK